MLALMLTIGAFTLWRLSPAPSNKSIDSESSFETADIPSKPSENNQQAETPEAEASGSDERRLVKYTNQSIGVTIEHPSDWEPFSCDKNSFNLLVDGEQVKCFTENYIKGPSFIQSAELTYSGCENVEDSPTRKSECKIKSIGNKQVLAATFTYTQDGEFGERKGDVYHLYVFLDENYKGLQISFNQMAGENNLMSEVEQIIESLEKVVS